MQKEIRKIIEELKASEIRSYIDTTLSPPKSFCGSGNIRLIILGQDPTVQNPKYREKIKVTLLLNQPGSLRRYMENICQALDFDLDKNIYATNLLKNFFTILPDKILKTDQQFTQKAAVYWISLLKKEIEEFEDVPILTLGEPVLNCLTKSPTEVLIRNYWGFEGKGEYGQKFDYIKPSENVLSRVIFPFPHIPGLSHKIYRQQMSGYLKFMKQHIS